MLRSLHIEDELKQNQQSNQGQCIIVLQSSHIEDELKQNQQNKTKTLKESKTQLKLTQKPNQKMISV